MRLAEAVGERSQSAIGPTKIAKTTLNLAHRLVNIDSGSYVKAQRFTAYALGRTLRRCVEHAVLPDYKDTNERLDTVSPLVGHVHFGWKQLCFGNEDLEVQCRDVYARLLNREPFEQLRDITGGNARLQDAHAIAGIIRAVSPWQDLTRDIETSIFGGDRMVRTSFHAFFHSVYRPRWSKRAVLVGGRHGIPRATNRGTLEVKQKNEKITLLFRPRWTWRPGEIEFSGQLADTDGSSFEVTSSTLPAEKVVEVIESFNWASEAVVADLDCMLKNRPFTARPTPRNPQVELAPIYRSAFAKA